jgi:tetratricopeptide (TPR) repeat protein
MAKSASGRAVDLARHIGRDEPAATYEAGEAVWEAFYGNPPEAKRDAILALDLSKGRDVEYAAAFALALAAEPAKSEALADDLAKRFPEDTSVQSSYLPVLHALAAMEQGDPKRAIELLRVSTPFELGRPGLPFNAFFGALYPAYVRGEAFLATHEYAQAAAEFQKFPDNPGIVFADPVDAMARLQLARALALSGDKTKAKAAYQDLLTLWKDADPDVPIFKEPAAESAKL